MATRYTVFLKRQLDGEADPRSAYEIVGAFEGANAKAAISAAAEKMGDKANGATFAATPERGWAEMKTKVEVKPRVSFT